MLLIIKKKCISHFSRETAAENKYFKGTKHWLLVHTVVVYLKRIFTRIIINYLWQRNLGNFNLPRVPKTNFMPSEGSFGDKIGRWNPWLSNIFNFPKKYLLVVQCTQYYRLLRWKCAYFTWLSQKTLYLFMQLSCELCYHAG